MVRCHVLIGALAGSAVGAASPIGCTPEAPSEAESADLAVIRQAGNSDQGNSDQGNSDQGNSDQGQLNGVVRIRIGQIYKPSAVSGTSTYYYGGTTKASTYLMDASVVGTDL